MPDNYELKDLGMDQLPGRQKTQDAPIYADQSKHNVDTNKEGGWDCKPLGTQFIPDSYPHGLNKGKAIDERVVKIKIVEPLPHNVNTEKVEKVTTVYEGGDSEVLVVKRFDNPERERVYLGERNVLSNLFFGERCQEAPRSLMKFEGFKDVGDEKHIYYAYVGEQFSPAGSNQLSKKFLESRSAVVNGAFELIQAVRYMHDHEVHHFDIRSDNICVDEQLRLTVIDYGISRVNSDLADMCTVETAAYIDGCAIVSVIRHTLNNSPEIDSEESESVLDACVELYNGKVMLPELKKRFLVDQGK